MSDKPAEPTIGELVESGDISEVVEALRGVMKYRVSVAFMEPMNWIAVKVAESEERAKEAGT